MEDEKIITAYVEAVLKELNCSKALSSVFRKKFSSEISNYAEENKPISYDALVKRFGTPADIAAGFLDRSDYQELLKTAKRKTRIWMWIGIIAAAIALIAVLFCLHMYHDLGGTFEISDAYEVSEAAN